ncbi:hypothetical protein IQ06DRAFT_297357 [Phaeosphaeriaceae sp. SRC1lsM3a]|nr:hypothetical protein IQ06DRAFT_297357 [Stagonospora sp. SRC1lsM3a]
MGIPIGWNIPREDATKKDVLHADVTGQRSPIRRRRTGRTRSPTSQSAFDAGFFVSSHAERVARRSRTSRPSYTSLSQQRVAPPPVPEVSRPAYDLSRDPPSLQREDARIRRLHLQHLMDARAEMDSASVDGERSLPALTPGFAPAAASREAEDDAHSFGNRATTVIVEDGSFVLERNNRDGSWRRLSPLTERLGAEARDTEDDHETSNHNAVSFPPLRRMGRRNIADGPLASSASRVSQSPVPTWDGLGDRQRSFSPSGESSQWDTFYGTIVPDAVAPTAESSFASAAASASFSNSHPSSRASSSNTSASSSHTHLTVPSRRESPPVNEQFMRACDTSDDDTASDTEAEEDSAPTAETIRHRYNPYTLRRRSRPSYFSDEPPQRDTERYSRRVTERTRAASAYVRSYYGPGSQRRHPDGDLSGTQRSPRMRVAYPDAPRMEQLDGPTDGPLSASDDEIPPVASSDSSTLDQELREARSLLERLSRRVDITDDFWASVGLTRSFADRVESFNERERL